MNGRYAKGREKLLCGEIAWLTDDIKAVFVTSSYTPNFATHEFLSDVPAPTRVATSDALSGKTATGGWAGGDQLVWQDFTGVTCVAFVVLKWTGLISTSPLLAYIDTGITNLPLDPPGSKVTLIIDPDTGLFRL